MKTKQNPALAEFTTKELIAEIGARTSPMIITYRDNEDFIQTNWGGSLLECLGLFTLLRRRFPAMIEEANADSPSQLSDGGTSDEPGDVDAE